MAAKGKKSATQKMGAPEKKKGSVKFNATSTNPLTQLFSSVYLNRAAAAAMLGVEDLDEVTELEITVTIL